MLINIGPILIAVLAGIFLKEGFPRWLFAGTYLAAAGDLARVRRRDDRLPAVRADARRRPRRLGWALLGETPPSPAAVGGALCLAGVYLARLDTSRKD
jgi:drug/metabolite transporter (DMT)-like permease